MWKRLEDKSKFAYSKKGLRSPFSLAKKRLYLGTHLRATRVFPTPTGRVEKDGEHLANGLEDKFFSVYSFLSYTRKKIETWFVSPASREYFGIKRTTLLSKTCQKIPFGKVNC